MRERGKKERQGGRREGGMVKGSNLFWGCNYDVTML